jgi:hypothetical protein
MRKEIQRRQALTSNMVNPDLLNQCPPRADADGFLCAYLETFEPIYRNLHVPTFHQDYDAFWQAPNDSTMVFRLKLSLVFAIGTTFCQDHQDYEIWSRSAHAWVHAAQWWLSGPSEKLTYTVDGVQIACLLVLARQVTSVGITSWSGMDIALRLAMAVGLHRDPATFPALSQFDSHIRRRLWYTALELSMQSAIGSNTPFTMTTEHYDTAIPDDIGDECFVEKDGSFVCDRNLSGDQRLPRQYPRGGVCLRMNIQRLEIEFIPVRLRVLEIVNGFRRDYDYEEAIELSDKLRKHCDEVTAYNDFSAQWLDICTRRYILLLHRPFLMRARTNPQYYYSRKICLESAMVISWYADYFLHLPAWPQWQMGKLMIVMRGPLNGALSLDMIMILGLEMTTQFEEGHKFNIVHHSPAAELARAQREPVMKILRHIQEQLLQIIALGLPSMKRYGYVTALLGQLDALNARSTSLMHGDEPENVAEEVTKTVHQAVGKLKPLLAATLARLPADETGAAGGPVYVDDFNFGDTDSAFGSIDQHLFPGLDLDAMLNWDL